MKADKIIGFTSILIGTTFLVLTYQPYSAFKYYDPNKVLAHYAALSDYLVFWIYAVLLILSGLFLALKFQLARLLYITFLLGLNIIFLIPFLPSYRTDYSLSSISLPISLPLLLVGLKYFNSSHVRSLLRLNRSIPLATYVLIVLACFLINYWAMTIEVELVPVEVKK